MLLRSESIEWAAISSDIEWPSHLICFDSIAGGVRSVVSRVTFVETLAVYPHISHVGATNTCHNIHA